ncbi:MAG: pyridoxal-phosphate dependent enzyme, partial [Dehalococcoidia bacterium]|nr:pyridoxal-phosphate dependent enzyme [Dehalococcoidia bacterium]
MADQKKFLLSENDIPKQWYNVQADLPKPIDPALHPGTGQPAGPEDFAPLFPMELIMQEVSQDRWIDIPEPVREMYRMWRPTPLIRATGLEKTLGTPAKIFYKYEGVSPVGSHKPNTAIAQAYYNKVEGTKRIVTETGAGQWGSALAFACQQFGLEAKVYMVKASFDQKPYRKSMMQTFGGTVTASPSPETNAG